MKSNYEKNVFKIKNDETHTFKIPFNKEEFYILRNSTYHKDYNKKIDGWNNDWKKWSSNINSKICFSINDIKIEEFEKKKIKEIIKTTNQKTRNLYSKRNEWNHSFRNWTEKNKEKNLNSIFEIYYLFFLLNLNLIIFDFYINDVWKDELSKNKKLKSETMELENKFIGHDKFLHNILNNFFKNSKKNNEKFFSSDSLVFKFFWKK